MINFYCKVCKKPKKDNECEKGCDKEDVIRIKDQSGALTREFLLLQGKCCKGGCKNCPYE